MGTVYHYISNKMTKVNRIAVFPLFAFSSRPFVVLEKFVVVDFLNVIICHI